jgi:hypothetical protein
MTPAAPIPPVVAMWNTIAKARGHKVTYTRPSTGQSIVGLLAVPGRSEFESSDGQGGAMLQADSRDWTFPASTLVLGAILTLPLKGDTVTDFFQGKTSVYEVLTPPYKESDNQGLILRVHSFLSKVT